MPPGGFSTKPSANSKASTAGAKARRRFPSPWSSITNGAWLKAKALRSTGPSVIATPIETAALTNWKPESSPNRQRSSHDHSGLPVWLAPFAGRSELRVAGRARKRDDIANVRHACEEHQQALEAQAEARVRHGDVTSQFRIPPVVLRLELVKFQVLQQLVQALFPLRAANDFANARHQDIHGGHRPGIVIQPHVEGLDFARIVENRRRRFEVLFGQEPFVFRLQVQAILDRKFKRPARILK